MEVIDYLLTMRRSLIQHDVQKHNKQHHDILLQFEHYDKQLCKSKFRTIRMCISKGRESRLAMMIL